MLTSDALDVIDFRGAGVKLVTAVASDCNEMSVWLMPCCVQNVQRIQ